MEELRGHVIICGFGRVGQTIGQLLAERLIPFVAVDVRVDRVQVRNLCSRFAGHEALLALLRVLRHQPCTSKCVSALNWLRSVHLLTEVLNSKHIALSCRAASLLHAWECVSSMDCHDHEVASFLCKYACQTCIQAVPCIT